MRRLGSIVVAAGVLAVAGCGGSGSDSSSATTKWADGVCSAVVDYKNELKDAASSVQSSPSKESLDNAVKDVKSATNTFVDKLDGLGQPDTKAAASAKQTLKDLSSELTKDANAIAAAGSESPLSLVSTVSTTLLSAQSQIKSAVAELKQLDAEGELNDAFSQASSCDSLNAK
jgi:hypothetical protein